MRPGDPWGEPTSAAPDLELAGGDADLARVVGTHPGALVRFRPDASSDLARAVGAAAGAAATGIAVPIDALVATPGGAAVNAVIVGTAPASLRAWTRTVPTRVEVDGRVVAAGSATTVVVASGQFVDGLDVIPRGHPGDGRLEVQVYALRRGERRAMRSRLPRGAHVPHPRITTAVGRQVRVVVERGRAALAIDGRRWGAVDGLTVEILPAALRLLL